MPQIILLDWHMPGMSGHEVLAGLKNIECDRKPVVVYCTTENDPQDLGRAFAGGAEAYLLKPYNRAILKAKIVEAVRLAA